MGLAIAHSVHASSTVIWVPNLKSAAHVAVISQISVGSEIRCRGFNDT